MPRVDIKQNDVFVSWTGKDRTLKNVIVKYLRDNGITCLESDHDCSGDFRQWSREAVHSCSIFLLLCSEHTFYSEYVPIEIKEYKKWEDYENRIVPVCTDRELYGQNLWGINEYASAVFLENGNITEEDLKKI